MFDDERDVRYPEGWKRGFWWSVWMEAKAKRHPGGDGVLGKKALAVTYSRMRMHTTIGAGSFHFRVREGIGWYQTAMAARETMESR